MRRRDPAMQTIFGRYRDHGQPPEWASRVVPIHFRRSMNFTEASIAEPSSCPDDLRPISALMAAHDTFRMLEGPHSARVHEVIQNLLRPHSRAALRRWYQRSGAADTAETEDFRSHLSQLAGEAL